MLKNKADGVANRYSIGFLISNTLKIHVILGTLKNIDA